MKLLVITQKVDENDDVLGFFHDWINCMADRFEAVNVVCLQEGQHSLSQNVRVWSLGKEYGASRWKYIYHFYKYIWRLRRDYEGVFVHMNPQYVVLGGLFWRVAGKKVFMWYAHKKGSYMRMWAAKLAHKVLTVSKESFVGFDDRKFVAMGHGINVRKFICAPKRKAEVEKKVILSVGRISPVKGYEILLEAVNILVNEFSIKNFIVKLVGGAANHEDEAYIASLKERTVNLRIVDYFQFAGPVPNKNILPHLCDADIFVSMQCHGGAGKSFLESMSSGILTLVCTPVFNDDLGDARKYFYYNGTPADMAVKLKFCLEMTEDQRAKYGQILRDVVVEKHNLNNLVSRIYELYQSV